MKIENVKVSNKRAATNGNAYADYIKALAKLKVGQSIVIPNFPSHYRIAVVVVQHLNDAVFRSEKCDRGIRVGRVQ